MGFLAGRRARQAESKAAVAAGEARHRAGQEIERLVAESRARRRARSWDAAATTLAGAVRLGTERLGPDDPRTLLAGFEHGRTLMLLRRWTEAEQALRAVVDAAAPHPDQRRQDLRFDALGVCGTVLLRAGRNAEAVAVLEEHRELARRSGCDLGGSCVAEDLADAYYAAGREAEAVRLYADTAAHREAEAGTRAETGAGRSDTGVLRLRSKMARALLHLGHHAQAERAARAVLKAAADNPAAVGRWTAGAVLARTLVQQGRAAEGEAVAREAAAEWRRAQGPESKPLPKLAHALAEALTAQQRYQEALEVALEQLAAGADGAGSAAGAAGAAAGVAGAVGGVAGGATLLHYDLAAAHLGLGRPEEALRAVEPFLAHYRAGLAAPDHTALVLDTLHGRILAALGRTGEARDVLAANAAAWRERYGPEHVRTLAAGRALAALPGE
ncbi:tetratricopeptide repeat protein [Kitasatospora cineracea]|uniref:Tetratricopeptide repeat protein n=1 Tax=Kitasatospora cineracea TaxID=88074 RepID=A0A8G1UCF2_9ACTN|nr:tetratricopeptide repeat protein [Kitasatospora cineracea]ROR38197.1 tetratricopeptide repeat protein [Kitasatospora cineracea]